MQNWIKTVVVAVSLALPGVVLAQSLESLVNVQGVRENQLVGYSLVVGLDGTGDKNQVKFTNQTITNMLRQFGVQLPNKIDPKVKNVAADVLARADHSCHRLVDWRCEKYSWRHLAADAVARRRW